MTERTDPTLSELGLAIGDRVSWRGPPSFNEYDGVIAQDFSETALPSGERFVEMKDDATGKVVMVSTAYLIKAPAVTSDLTAEIETARAKVKYDHYLSQSPNSTGIQSSAFDERAQLRAILIGIYDELRVFNQRRSP